MKLKVSLFFFILAAAFVLYTLKGGYFSTPKPEIKTTNSMVSEDILKKILSFDLRDYAGNKIAIDQAFMKDSKKVVIHLWASWCGPCINEVPELIDFSKRNPDVKFIIVSLDDYQDDIAKFMKSFPEFNSSHFIKIWDSEKKISKFLDADRLPMSIIIQVEKSEPQILKAVVDWKRIKI